MPLAFFMEVSPWHLSSSLAASRVGLSAVRSSGRSASPRSTRSSPVGIPAGQRPFHREVSGLRGLSQANIEPDNFCGICFYNPPRSNHHDHRDPLDVRSFRDRHQPPYRSCDGSALRIAGGHHVESPSNSHVSIDTVPRRLRSASTSPQRMQCPGDAGAASQRAASGGVCPTCGIMTIAPRSGAFQRAFQRVCAGKRNCRFWLSRNSKAVAGRLK